MEEISQPNSIEIKLLLSIQDLQTMTLALRLCKNVWPKWELAKKADSKTPSLLIPIHPLGDFDDEWLIS